MPVMITILLLFFFLAAILTSLRAKNHVIQTEPKTTEKFYLQVSPAWQVAAGLRKAALGAMQQHLQ